jgi:hypothetical protein
MEKMEEFSVPIGPKEDTKVKKNVDKRRWEAHWVHIERGKV